MNTQEIRIAYTVYNDLLELTEKDRTLVKAAVKASALAYAPYSRFNVGAAVRLENEMIFTGNNQENSAYPSGLCAERVALFTASSMFPGIAVDTIAIAASTDIFEMTNPVTPCGACRQVMAEYENLGKKPMRVLLTGGGDQIWLLEGISSLLPLMFYTEKLKK